MKDRDVAGAVEAILVKGRRRLFRIVEIPLHHVRPGEAHLIAAIARHQLERQAWRGQADADPGGGKMNRHAARDRLGHAIAGGHVDAVAGLGDRQFLQPVIDRLGEPGTAIEHQPHLGEEARAQLRILLHRIDQHRIAGGHVVEIGDRNLAQVGDGLVEKAGKRLARIDMQRAAFEQAGAHDGRTSRVMPGQPVEHDIIPACCLSDHVQPLRAACGERGQAVRHDLGQAGRAGGEHEDRRGRRIDSGDGVICDTTGIGGDEIGIGGRPGEGGRVAADELCALRCGRRQRSGDSGVRFGEDHIRRRPRHHVPETRIIAARQTVSDADRYDDHARSPGGKGHHRDRQAVLGDDQQPCATREMVGEPAGRAIHVALDLRIAAIGPLPICAAPADRRSIALQRRACREGARDISVEIAQRNAALKDDRAISAPFDIEVDRHELGFAKRRAGQHDRRHAAGRSSSSFT